MAGAVTPKSAGMKKYAVVTGANKGIGLEICRQLASQGVSVVLTARNEKRGLDAVEKLNKSGLSDYIMFHQLDVMDSASIDSLAAFIKSEIGKLDILVNNAGVNGITDSGVSFLTVPLLENQLGICNKWGETLNDIENLTDERIDLVLDEYLKDVKEGSAEAKGWPSYWGVYCVSKAAVTAYTRLLAKKYPKMLINCVCPGWVKTDLSNHSGPLRPEEGARSPVRLALLPDDGPSGLFFNRMQVSSF
ncbi:UNVERIFIED_CONTAM: (+)-neomenthol dehydrogenase [Sesamum latifolium]|uniref:(+)-neomenthol dehydrogenase n=1 Tax=Sesamum latifolium TaxID=2727402 RepID=A0AAW2YG41_9LAMI